MTNRDEGVRGGLPTAADSTTVGTTTREERASSSVSSAETLGRVSAVGMGSVWSPSAAVGWISLAALAQVLGRSNARAARDWCNRHAVPYRRDGKHSFTRVEDVQRVLEGLPVRGSTLEEAKANTEAARAAASIMSKGRR